MLVRLKTVYPVSGILTRMLRTRHSSGGALTSDMTFD